MILVFLFGSLLAASLPLLTAVFAVGSTLGLLVLGSHLFTIPDYTAPVMMLVGLGVGIDYALLIFSRYRSELLKGADRPKAGRRSPSTPRAARSCSPAAQSSSRCSVCWRSDSVRCKGSPSASR